MLKSFVNEDTGKKIRFDKNHTYTVDELEEQMGMKFKGEMPTFLAGSKDKKESDEDNKEEE